MGENKLTFQQRLLKAIPGGAHTYSRGFDQFPANAPEILSSGKGAYVCDVDGNELLDYGMALRAVNLGYANEEVDQAAFKQIKAGNNLTRASTIELEAAEALVELVDSVDMVKFTKNGSTAVSAAVKLARAYTGRELIARCVDHPFFSFDDWFIGSTNIKKGIPENVVQQTKNFPYDDIDALEALFEQHPEQFACVVLEASTVAHPGPSKYFEGKTFLHDVEHICKKHGVVFILDEMITGFRWDLKGAQHFYGITPDLTTFGKAMANGFSVAAIGGRDDIMQLGSIEFEGQERVFLLSTTHGAEMSGLGAFVATLSYMQRNRVVEHIWQYGKDFIHTFNQVAIQVGVEKYLVAGGVECSPYYITLDVKGQADLVLRTLFNQEMIKRGVLMPWIALSYSHKQEELNKTREALVAAMTVCKQALEGNMSEFVQGPVIKPVFRQFN